MRSSDSANSTPDESGWHTACDSAFLSQQLSFAVVPLVQFTGDRRKMGDFVAPLWMRVLAWMTAAIIVVLTLQCLLSVFGWWG